MKIFVYGTLKKKYGNNALLRDANFVEEKVIPGYKLYNCGFPVAVPNKTTSISGEVYEIKEGDKQTLYNLDRLEAEGRMYDRIRLDDFDLSLYVGNPHFWNFSHLEECPKENNIYSWNR